MCQSSLVPVCRASPHPPARPCLNHTRDPQLSGRPTGRVGLRRQQAALLGFALFRAAVGYESLTPAVSPRGRFVVMDVPGSLVAAYGLPISLLSHVCGGRRPLRWLLADRCFCCCPTRGSTLSESECDREAKVSCWLKAFLCCGPGFHVSVVDKYQEIHPRGEFHVQRRLPRRRIGTLIPMSSRFLIRFFQPLLAAANQRSRKVTFFMRWNQGAI